MRVKSGSKTPGIEKGADGVLTVRVAARAVEGQANKAVIQSLAAAFGVAPSRIAIISGEKSKLKRFEIPDGTVLKL